jgi:hypothetical protein
MQYTIPGLAPAITYDVLQTLRTTLPPPANDTPGDLEARIETAMAVVVAYHPGDISEALLAAQIVAADAHAKDCFRLAIAPGADSDTVRRCRSQAASMARLMQSGLRSLQRTQAMREKQEAAMHPAAMERAGWWFRDASVAEPDSAVPPADAPEPARTAPTAVAADDEPVADLAREAEAYAMIYPDRAALIREYGGLPARVTFGPPAPELVAAIVSGASPALLAADDHPWHPCLVAA